MSTKKKVGVLALQGGFAKHLEMLATLGVEGKEVRMARELAQCDALIIPGGESTTIHKQLIINNLRDKIEDFSRDHPIYGTCAGLILMSKEIVGDHDVDPFGWLDIVVKRNAYGSQADSFKETILLDFAKKAEFPAIFIRAPKISSIGPHVEVLASCQKSPILVRQGHFLASTFHPELTNNPVIHQYFLSLINNIA